MSCSAFAALRGPGGGPMVQAAITNINEVLRLDINAFPSLALNSGSAIITFTGGVTAILINRESDTDFYAMDPTCPHAGWRVPPYSIATNSIVCPHQSSEFDIQGHVIHGPAVTNLNTYATQFEGGSTLNIEVPGLVHRIDEIALHATTPGAKRVRLTFPTMAGSEYQVRHSPDLAAPFEVISFATTAAGAADQTMLAGTGAPKTVYVDAAGDAGFFTLELMVYQLAP